MATLLCASCGHSFPDELLEPAAFSDRVGRCLSHTAQLVRDTQGKTVEDTHRLVQITQLLQQLSGVVHEEVRALRGRQKDHRGAAASGAATATAAGVGGGGPSGAAASQWRRGGAADAPSYPPTATTTQAATQPQMTAMTMSGTLMGSTARQQSALAATMDRTAKMFDGAVPSYQLRRMVSAFDLVSATLYNMLEALAVQSRASVALLWLRPRQSASSELVAPFVVGRDVAALANCAPYSTPESSVPCAVCQTGVALNLQPQPHLPSNLTPSTAAELSLTELMEQTNAAQLLVPVHDRYAERNGAVSAAAAVAAATRSSVTPAAPASSVLAVVHLIGSPIRPVPFHRHNEETAAQTASLLSAVLSSYHDAMMVEWANRFYVPATLQATAKYAAGLDLRADEKVMDDFTVPPLLIYRCPVPDPRELQSANEARDAVKGLQYGALVKSSPLRPMANIRDLCQHASNMESNWVSAVQQTARLEKEIAALEEEVLRRDVSALQRTREGGAGRRSIVSLAGANSARPSSMQSGRGAGKAGQSLPSTAASALPPSPAAAADAVKSLSNAEFSMELTPAVAFPVDTAQAVVAAGNPLPPLSGDVLKPEQMEALEAATLRRLKNLGADTTIFDSST